MKVVIICFFQAEDGIRDLVRSRGLGDVYKRQQQHRVGVEPAQRRALPFRLARVPAGEGPVAGPQRQADRDPVSYTHLTLPTIYSV